MKLTNPITRSLSFALVFLQTTGAGPITLTAKSANVAQSGTPIKVNILRWSTDEERKPIVAALDPAAQQAAAQARESPRTERSEESANGGDGDDRDA